MATQNLLSLAFLTVAIKYLSLEYLVILVTINIRLEEGALR